MATTNAFDIPLAVSVKFEFDTMNPGEMVPTPRRCSTIPEHAARAFAENCSTFCMQGRL